MDSKWIACAALVLAMMASQAVGKPFEIVFRDMDSPSAPIFYSTEPVQARKPCSQPQYKVQQDGNKVKYILDYRMKLPCPPRRPATPPVAPTGAGNNLWWIPESPIIIRNRCTCKNPSVVKESYIINCPVHSPQPRPRCQNEIPRLLDIPLPSDGVITAFSRVKRDAPKKKAFSKKHIFSKTLKSEKSKFLNKHTIQKREAAQPVKRQAAFQMKKQYKFPEVVQYFPEVLAKNYKPGECFTCCSTQKQGELVCQPNGQAVQYGAQFSTKSSPYRTSLTLVDSNDYPYQSQGSVVEVVNDEDSARDQAYHEYIKSVIHSHGDFFTASGLQKGLVKSAEIQKADARDLIKLLLHDQLAKKHDESLHEDSRYTRDYRSPQLELVPPTKQVIGDSILVKLTHPPNQPQNLPPQ